MELINDILNLSKVEAGRVDVEPDSFDLVELALSLMTLLRVNAQQKGLVLELNIEDGTPRHVEGDRRLLRQILINLIGNAIKYTEIGSITVRIADTGDNAGNVEFEVTDTGVGIAEEAFEEVFEPFSQIASEKTVSQGTGLGLAISRKLARAMGGEIVVKSQIDQGSVFTLKIPFKQISKTDDPVDRNVSIESSEEAEICIPSRSVLEELGKQATSGYVDGVREILGLITDKEYASFVLIVEKKLQDFDLDGIAELVKGVNVDKA